MWAADSSYDVLGTPFRIKATTPEVDGVIRHLLAPFVLDAQVPARARNTFGLVEGRCLDEARAEQFLAYQDCRAIGVGIDWGTATSQLMASLNRAAIEQTPLFATHAGVIATDAGAIALPADSGAGKSTLAAACVGSGFGYVSDEALCIDVDSGRVVPYPKPIGLSRWSRRQLGIPAASHPSLADDAEEALIPGAALGEVVSAGLELTDVVLSEYGHDDVRIEEVAASEAMFALLHFSFNHYKYGEQAFRLVSDLANRVRTWRLRYRDPVDAARLLRARLG